MKLRDMAVRKIFDSRGEPTIAVDLIDGGGSRFTAEVPSGKSRGKREAAVFGYEKAREVVSRTIRGRITDWDFATVRDLDNFLIKLDGTERKEKLGGDVTLGISVAFARALAFRGGRELWELLNGEFFEGKDGKERPAIFSNLINGGVHAGNNLAIQEYLAILKPAASFEESVETLLRLYEKVGTFLAGERKDRNLPIGDEGGYAVDFQNNFEPVAVLEERIRDLELGAVCSIGLDAAASSFYKDGAYQFEGKALSTEELAEVYAGHFEKSERLTYIEDPFSEEDRDGFRQLREKAGSALIVGDDLTTTNPASIAECARDGLINAVIIKPNQIGTVSEACEAMRSAKKNGLRYIVSHRSGETADSFIIHLAKAGGAYGVKIGAPVRERMPKFNELIRIYDSVE